LGQLFCPLGLSVFYPHPENHLAIWKVVVALLVLAGISLAALAFRRRPYLLVGWLWYLGMMVPTIGVVQVGLQAMADRYTYLPQIGLSIALAWGVTEVSRSWPSRRWVCAVGSALVMASLVACAWLQTSYWYSSQTLWTHAVTCNSENAKAHYYLGLVLSDVGQVDEAIVHFRKSLEIEPDGEKARLHLNIALAQAVTIARRAVELSPADPHLLRALAAAYADAGRLAEAEQTARKAVDLAAQQGNPALAAAIQAKIPLHGIAAPGHDLP
jgi:tetratricopeptide (TPR) repeat protein